MSLIPKIQYLFRTLQVPLPKQYLKNMQHTINTFIWEGEKARVAAGTLQQAVHRGELGLPNLTAYCRAAYLHNISQINLPANASQWVAIESHWVPRRDLRALIWQEKCPRHTQDKLLPSTQTLLQIWHKIRDKLVAKQTLPMATPLQTIGLDIPTFPWETWAKGGIHHIYQVIDRGRLKPLPAIQEEYTLPSKVIFSYMQLKSYVSSKLGAEDESKDGINMTKFEKHCVGIKKLGKTLSWGYQELITTQTQTLDKIKQAWHQELGQTFPDDTWGRAYLAHQGLTGHPETHQDNSLPHHYISKPDDIQIVEKNNAPHSSGRNKTGRTKLGVRTHGSGTIWGTHTYI
ncbi:Hypothetical predicted protein [Pelobates cultripes]|uniref:Uncharacterized protein n=1 Tax=Pelobates cultripes TaxID=61616 RepID=A0AAD1S9S3_PELCU|nr:Hypothetical predicted protein [Pelobates cultripes]